MSRHAAKSKNLVLDGSEQEMTFWQATANREMIHSRQAGISRNLPTNATEQEIAIL